MAEVIARPTAAQIQAAITLGTQASDEHFAVLLFTDEGPLNGVYVSTPLCRVAAAAADAKRKYKAFRLNDTSALVTPVAEAVVEPLRLGPDFTDDLVPAEHVVLARPGLDGQFVIVQPRQISVFTKTVENRLGMKKSADGVRAIFGAEALEDDAELRAIYAGGIRRTFRAGHLADCEPTIRKKAQASNAARREEQTRKVAAERADEVAAEIPRLSAQLQTSVAVHRAQAATRLGELGPAARAAVPGLMALLHDSDLTVRSSAVQALGNIGPAALEAVPALEQMREDPALRFTVATAIEKIRKAPQ